MDQTTIKLDLPASNKHLNVLGACVSAILDRVDKLKDRDTVAYNMELALHETCTNIVNHAYGNKKKGRIKIELSLVEKPKRQLVIDLRDTGKSFDLKKAKEPKLEEAQVHGYGLYLMKQLLDEVIYEPETGNNHWKLVKNL